MKTYSCNKIFYLFLKFLTQWYCRPLLKLVDRLLLVGMLRDEDVEKLLIMVHPETWDPTFEKGCTIHVLLYNIF